MGRIKISPRYGFQSPEGYILVSCDFAAVEMRVAGAVAKVKKLLELYLLEKEYDLGLRPRPRDPDGNEYSDPKVDVHTASASVLNAEVKRLLEEEPWLANKDNPIVATARKHGKVLSFEVLFGGSAASISVHIKKTVEETEQMLKDYFSKDGYWELEVSIKSFGNIAKKQGWVRSATGRMAYCKEANSKGLEDLNTVGRKSFNSVIQGTAADINKLALVYADEGIERLNEELKDVLNGRTGRLISVVH